MPQIRTAAGGASWWSLVSFARSVRVCVQQSRWALRSCVELTADVPHPAAAPLPDGVVFAVPYAGFT